MLCVYVAADLCVSTLCVPLWVSGLGLGLGEAWSSAGACCVAGVCVCVCVRVSRDVLLCAVSVGAEISASSVAALRG